MVQQVHKALIAAIVAAFAFWTVSVSSVHAAGGLTLSPTLKDLTIGPGLLETTNELALTNNTPQVITAKLRLVDLRALGQFGGTSLDQAGLTESYDLADWMSLPAGDTVTLPPNQTTKIKVNISNRNDLTPGGHYGAIIVSAESAATTGNVSVNQQLVSLIFVKKLGGEKYGLELKELLADADKPIPKKVKLRFVSTGNVHVIPRGYIEVTDPKGKLVSKGIINQDSLFILPSASRDFDTQLQTVMNPKASGQYKITAYYRYDGTDKFHTQSVYFTHTGAPGVMTYIVAVILGLVTVLGVIIIAKKRSK